ncbi:DUF3515 family protein [Rhizomonospora bruguierae]|uniref:DUF3515 family protein n=1 Tax=Rhizomonospora bruguierae TaxID=1581705 RepID=UPI001BCBBFC1|nr:DUF3515 family protein [Micromonospora sp. NBRC 107566]
MADQVTRSAARLATLVALPLAVVAGLLVFGQLGGSGDPAATTATPSASAAPRPVPSTPVEMPAPALAARQATVCRALTAQLPADIRELPQRRVTAGPEQNAAYGEPAITVACGVPPATYPPTDDVFNLNQVCWHAAPGGGGTVWTTVDREVPVRVVVPAGYEQPGQWTIAFSKPVATSVPSLTEGIPFGCTG